MQRTQSSRAHVLTLSDTIGLGGAEQVVFVLNRSLDRESFRPTVCLTRHPSVADPSGEFESLERIELLRAAGVEVLQLRRRSSINVFAWLQLIRFIRSQHVDIIHAHKFGSNFWGAVIGKLTKVPVVLAHEHSWSFEGQRLRRWINRSIIGRFATAVITVSEADRRRMSEVVGIPPDRIVLVPNGIPPLPPGDGMAIRREVGIPDGARVLVTLANLRPEKALHLMVEAVALLRASFPYVYLLIAGGGDREPLEALAAELGIADAVVLLGVRLDVANVLAAGDIAVISSDFEGSPLSAMEYLAAGLPVVATDVGGLPDLVRQGENGLLVPRRDPVALAAAVGELLSDPARAAEMGERGRLLQREQFSLDAMIRRLEALYTDTLEDSRGRVNGPVLA